MSTLLSSFLSWDSLGPTNMTVSDEWVYRSVYRNTQMKITNFFCSMDQKNFPILTYYSSLKSRMSVCVGKWYLTYCHINLLMHILSAFITPPVLHHLLVGRFCMNLPIFETVEFAHFTILIPLFNNEILNSMTIT